MGLNAIAILHVSPSVVFEALPPSETAPERRRAANGEDVDVVALKDAVLVHLELPLASEPEALADRLDALLGDLLDVHDDPRGVPVYPDSYSLSGESWDAVAAELGEAADWIAVGAGDPMAAMMQQLGGLDPAAMMGGLDPSALQGMLGGQDPAAMMETVMKMMGHLADSGALEDLAKKMGDVSPPPGMDMSALAAQAEKALADDPELEGKLRQALAAARDDDESE